MAGEDADGSSIYVGRAHHDGDLIPAKVVPAHRKVYVPYGGSEHVKLDCEILCHGEVEWIHDSNGQVPANAVRAGHTKCGETLYVGRAYHCSVSVLGKIQPSHRVLYFSFDGQELSTHNYEVLVEC